MILVPIRKQFKELDYKGISAKPENILSVQNYIESLNTDPERNIDRSVPIGISDSIKDKIGISKMEFFLDQNGKIYMQENNQNENHLIEFQNMDNVRRIY